MVKFLEGSRYLLASQPLYIYHLGHAFYKETFADWIQGILWFFKVPIQRGPGNRICLEYLELDVTLIAVCECDEYVS